MVQHIVSRQSVFNVLHSPSDTEGEHVSDGIKTEVSLPFKTPFPFSSLVLSANYRSVTDGCILFEAQVCCGGKWSGFYKLGLLSGKFKTSFPPQEDAFGRVETDVLTLFKPAEAYRYRLKFYGDAELFLLCASLTRAPFMYEEKTAVRLPAGAFEKEVHPISQLEQTHPDRRRICSPVSLCMALNALGYQADVKELMRDVFDQTAGIYGNWMFNVASAGALGAEAYVRRFGALGELKDFVTPDSLVLASVAYGRGELAGAAIDHTAGHLVLVRGWKKGKILAADPAAAKQESVLRAYDAREFANAWLSRKQGAAYVVRKK